MTTVSPLEKADLRILLEVYVANAHCVEIGMSSDTPFLFAGRRHKRARALCERGLLKHHTDVKLLPPPKDMLPVSITKAGIAAYNATMAELAMPPEGGRGE